MYRAGTVASARIPYRRCPLTKGGESCLMATAHLKESGRRSSFPNNEKIYEKRILQRLWPFIVLEDRPVVIADFFYR